MRNHPRLKERSRASEGSRQLNWRCSETLAPIKASSIREPELLNNSHQTTNLNSSRLTPLTMRRSLTKLGSRERSKSALNPVYDFLENCGLEQHYKVIADHGINEVETLKEMSDSKLTELNIPLGHRIKLMKRLRSSSNVPPQETLKVDENTTTNKKIPLSEKTACWKLSLIHI